MATTTYGTPYVSGTDLVANWPAASLTVANSIDAAGYYVGRGINAQTASYTGVLTDAGKTVTMTNAGATTFTVPANASVAYPTGTRINILNLGAGACTPTAGAGVTISGTITALATNESASVIKTATNTWSYLAAPTPGSTPVATGTVTAGTAITFNNTFDTNKRRYLVLFTGVGSSASPVALLARLRVSGADNSTSAYLSGGTYVTHAAGPSRDYQNTTQWYVGSIGDILASCAVEVFDPFPTTSSGFTSRYAAPGTGTASYGVYSGAFTTATSFTGLTIYCASGTMTAQAAIYAYAG